MKSVDSQEKDLEKEEIQDTTEKKEETHLDPLEKYKKLSAFTSKEEDPIKDNETENKRDDPKPWRQNMKKSTSKECK